MSVTIIPELIPLYAGFGFLVGSCFGSAILCYIHRKEVGESWVHGRSRCDTCGEVLRWYDLIPVISYISSGGKCRHCEAKIPSACLKAEITYGILFIAPALSCMPGIALTIQVPVAASVCLASIIVFKVLRKHVQSSTKRGGPQNESTATHCADNRTTALQ